MSGEDSRKEWGDHIGRAKRRATPAPGQMRALRPAEAEQVDALIDVISELGEQNLRLIEEMKKQKSMLAVAVLLVLATFAGGVILQQKMAKQQSDERELDRKALSAAVTNAKAELADDVSETTKKVEQAAELTKQSVREAMVCQIEASDVKARIAPPRERKMLKKKLEKKKAAAEKLGAELR